MIKFQPFEGNVEHNVMTVLDHFQILLVQFKRQVEILESVDFSFLPLMTLTIQGLISISGFYSPRMRMLSPAFLLLLGVQYLTFIVLPRSFTIVN